METEIIKGNLTALAPIHHGGSESYGTTKLILQMPTVLNFNSIFLQEIYTFNSKIKF